jgi:hypothetical protein
MLTTERKGVIAEAAITLAALELGVGVSSGRRCYDLIFDLRDRLVPVQCKWASRHGDVVAVRCYSARRNAEGLLVGCTRMMRSTHSLFIAPM